MLAELIDAVVGVDTHRDTHEVELALPTGTAIGTRKISNDNSGFAELLAWIVDHAPGPRVVVSIEGTRSFGVGLARAVAAAGLTVIECEQPNRKARRGKGKSDPIDAHLAVLAALRLDADRLPVPRADGDREALRILLGTRHELSMVTTAQTNRLRALLLGGGDTERDLARATLTDPVLGAMARRREPPQASREQAVRHGEIPTSPLQASSGKTVRHRLNRGGDRALNSAIHTIAITRMRCCPTTKHYVARRTAEGKSSRDIQRCLKRYIARELYRALNASTTLTAQTLEAPAAA
jgi:transposase